ncbi:putative disease resistance protein [Senna tora]|uniref:Putative disease resistance protein n=1 Tax=Senna tora TaxID=362788 RepID=A0A834WQY1_9FABA|nr:putative disease resistance protein [Senna tora]
MKAYLRAQSLWSVLESDAEPTPLVANTTVAQRRQYDEEVAKKPWALTCIH